MSTITLERPRKAPATARRRKRQEITGHFEETITGRYRPIPAQQIALAWWCYIEGHITRRQLRVWFAAGEMAERRCYGRTQSAREKPVFRLAEIQALVGGRGSESAARALAADLRHLSELGLVHVEAHAIRFAKSADALAVGEGGGDAFAAFLKTIPNRSRTVPVPRRMLRALAAGFGRAETACIIAYLIRSVFWHRESGLYRVDGRMKLSAVAELFGVSRRALTDARAHLIDLGWLRPLEVPQWAANRYGVHDVVNVHWSPVKEGQKSTEAPTDSSPDFVDNSGLEPRVQAGESASPTPCFAGESASPRQNRSPSTKNLNTRKLGPNPGPRGGGNRKREVGEGAPPTIRDVKLYDLTSTVRLIELHRQAVAVGLAKGGQAGQLDFLSLANRARMRGHNAGALLVWLLREGKSDWITISDEETAARRLREHFNGPDTREPGRAVQKHERHLSPDEKAVEAVLRAARQHRISDPFRVAQQAKGWTRARWDEAHVSYQSAQMRHWYAGEEMSA